MSLKKLIEEGVMSLGAAKKKGAKIPKKKHSPIKRLVLASL
jgi:hypothetical protein